MLSSKLKIRVKQPPWEDMYKPHVKPSEGWSVGDHCAISPNPCIAIGDQLRAMYARNFTK